MFIVEFLVCAALVLLLAVETTGKLAVSKPLLLQDRYMGTLSQNGRWKSIKVAERLLRSKMVKAGYTENKDLQSASLTALKAKYLYRQKEKLLYLSASLRAFNDIYDLKKKTNDKQALYDFHVYRGMTYIDFPDYLRHVDRLALADLNKAIGLALDLGRPDEELAEIYLIIANKYHADRKTEEARAMAQKVMAITEDPNLYRQAQRISAENNRAVR